MEVLFFVFIGFILLIILASGNREVRKTVKKDYTEDFKAYFYSLSIEYQRKFVNSLDYIHKLQFEDYMKSDNTPLPEFFIKEFNSWANNKSIDIQPFDLSNYHEAAPKGM